MSTRPEGLLDLDKIMLVHSSLGWDGSVIGANARAVGLKYMFHISYEPVYFLNLVGPEMNILSLVINGIHLLGRNSFKFFWIPSEEIQ